jgi:branched-subunit amino acid aminotransferase/4-amino-4-deoxychorismate lyase
MAYAAWTKGSSALLLAVRAMAQRAGVDDALMLDVHGFLSETNATNVFVVHDDQLLTPHADSCVPGITRRTVLELAAELSIPARERNVSLTEAHAAQEMFTTGTMGELSPVVELDGRTIGDGAIGPITRQLQTAYAEKTAQIGVPIPK